MNFAQPPEIQICPPPSDPRSGCRDQQQPAPQNNHCPTTPPDCYLAPIIGPRRRVLAERYASPQYLRFSRMRSRCNPALKAFHPPSPSPPTNPYSTNAVSGHDPNDCDSCSFLPAPAPPSAQVVTDCCFLSRSGRLHPTCSSLSLHSDLHLRNVHTLAQDVIQLPAPFFQPKLCKSHVQAILALI